MREKRRDFVIRQKPRDCHAFLPLDNRIMDCSGRLTSSLAIPGERRRGFIPPKLQETSDGLLRESPRIRHAKT
jgi:hypothetical protein